MLALGVGSASAAMNVAINKPVSVYPVPNYAIEGDPSVLTDGSDVDAVIGSGTVGWGAKNVEIVIDLQKPGCANDHAQCQSISEIKFQVQHRDTGVVLCPARVLFEVSDDGQVFHPVSDLSRTGCSIPNTVCSQSSGDHAYFITTGPIQTRGAYVRLHVETPTPAFLFTDEVWVMDNGTDTTDTNYLPEQNFDVELDALGTNWRVFASNPWAAGNERTLPSPAADATAVAFKLAADETGAAGLLISNPYAYDIGLPSSVTSLTGPGGATLPASTVTIRSAIESETELFETGGPSNTPENRADALVSTASVPALAKARGMSHLFLEAAVPAGTASGLYQGTLYINCPGCPNGNQSKTLNLSIDVRNFTLPTRHDLGSSFYDWSYSIPGNDAFSTDPVQNAARASIRQKYGDNGEVNYLVPIPGWNGSQMGNADFTALQNELALYPNAKLHLLAMFLDNSNRLHFDGNACYPTGGIADWDTSFGNWVNQIKTFMQGRGFTPQDYALYLVDEPHVTTFATPPRTSLPGYFVCAGGTNDGTACSVDANCTGGGTCTNTICPAQPNIDTFQFLQHASSIIHAAGLKVYENVNEYFDTTALSSLNTSIDIWSPPYGIYYYQNYCWADSLFLGAKQFYDGRKAAGATVFTYNSEPPLGRNDSSPHHAGRLVPWQNFKDGFTGLGNWALYAVRSAGSGLTSLWKPWDGPQGPGSYFDWGFIYLPGNVDTQAPAGVPTDESIIPSRRFAAWRQGIEDVRYLSLLKSRIAQYSSFNTSAYQTVLTNALNAVTGSPDDLSMPDTQRELVASAIAAMNDSDGDGAPDFADCAPTDPRRGPTIVEATPSQGGLFGSCNDGVDNDCDGVVDLDCAIEVNVTNGQWLGPGAVDSGTIANMRSDSTPNTYQVLKETGPIKELVAVWTFTVPTNASTYELQTEAFHTSGTNADNWDFSYLQKSDSNQCTNQLTGWQPTLFTVTNTSDPNTLQHASIGSLSAGTVCIRAVDTRQSSDNNIDKLTIDRLYLFPAIPSCPDVDGDGYASTCTGCTNSHCPVLDCDDTDAGRNPGLTEVTACSTCTDGKDNDCDGLTDAQDPSCGAQADATAVGETVPPTIGTIVSGSYVSTWSTDGVSEQLKEAKVGNVSQLKHTWTFTVPAGCSHTLNFEATRTTNSEGDNFQFYWATDPSNDNNFTAISGALVNSTFFPPGGISATFTTATAPTTIYIRVMDTNQASGAVLDTLTVGRLTVKTP